VWTTQTTDQVEVAVEEADSQIVAALEAAIASMIQQEVRVEAISTHSMVVAMVEDMGAVDSMDNSNSSKRPLRMDMAGRTKAEMHTANKVDGDNKPGWSVLLESMTCLPMCYVALIPDFALLAMS
jgi:hypothetical protein